jgi:catechol 2,3-dioxygenase-like lactoylglutathione lyase family enzyme
MRNAATLFLVISVSASMCHAQSAAEELASAHFYAIGVYTPIIADAVAQYRRVFGVVPENFGIAVPIEPDRKKVVLSMYVVFFPNFYIKLQEPISDNGPYAADLDRYGMGIQNFQLSVTDISSVRTNLIQKGGRWTLSYDPDVADYLDFHSRLGTTLEITKGGGAPRKRVKVDPDAPFPALGSLPVSHIEIVVPNIKRALQAYSNVFGMVAPVIEDRPAREYPPGSRGDHAAHLRIARWQQGEIGIELIEPIGGGTPWSRFLRKKHGPAPYSIAFDVGNRFDQIKRDLQKKGGKWVYGREGGNEAYFDFTSTLGLVIEIMRGPRHFSSGS